MFYWQEQDTEILKKSKFNKFTTFPVTLITEKKYRTEVIQSRTINFWDLKNSFIVSTIFNNVWDLRKKKRREITMTENSVIS